jgi:hypothetical protein
METVLWWFGGWLIPAVVLYCLCAGETNVTRSISTYDASGKLTGKAEIETGETCPGNPTMGGWLALLWIIGYMCYWLFYGWWQ